MPKAWRTVRVFVSSTFRDMHAERNHLVRVVFPALRERLEPLRVHLVDIDLRWGVTREQADNNQVLDLCLRYVDDCRPFYIGILGERYGWIPDSLSRDALGEFPWLSDYPDRSLTEIEILHAVLHYPATGGHAFFYFRDPAALGDIPDRIAADVYLESDPDRAGRLRELKDRIRGSGFPVMESYPARWDPALVDRINRTQGELAGLEVFGERLFEQLWEAIQAELGLGVDSPDAPAPDPLAEEADYHDRFMESRLRVYVGRNTLEYQLRQYVAGGAQVPCVLTGPSGSGKSAALAKLVTALRHSHPEWLILPHFVGASPESTDLRRMLRRFCLVLRDGFGFDEEVPSDLDHVIGVFDRYLALIPSDARVAIVIDALNQLDTAGHAHDLHWLPVTLPGHVKLVASCIEDPDRAESVLDAFNARPHHLVRVEALSDVERFQIVHDVPSLSAKTLDHTQVGQLLANPATTNPLFLLVALEELRGFGSFERLRDRIDAFPRGGDTVTALFTQVIERLEGDFDAGLVRRVLTYLASARRGLSEVELRSLIGSADLFPVLRQLRPYLQHRGALLDFYHRNLFKAVRARYLATPNEETVAHRDLADYFGAQDYARQGSINVRKVDELPWQRLQAEQWDDVERLFTDPGFLESKTEAGLIFDLAGDFEHALRVFPPGRTAARTLRLFDEALRRDLHFVARRPTTLFQCLWNSCWWYDSPLSALYFEAPAAGSSQPSPKERSPRLFELLEAWRGGRKLRGTQRPWLRSLRPPAIHLGAGQLAVLKARESQSLCGLGFIQNDERVVSGLVKGPAGEEGYRSTIAVWDTQSGQQLRAFADYQGQLSNVCCSSDGARVLSGSWDGMLQLWDVATGLPIRTVAAHPSYVEALAFSRDGRYIASAPGGPYDPHETIDGAIRIHDGETLEELAVLRGHDRPVHAVAFSPGGRWLVSASADGTVRVWDFEAGTPRLVLPSVRERIRRRRLRYMDAMRDVAWFPDGERIASVGADKTLRIWSVVTGDQVLKVKAHQAQVRRVAIASDGRRIASGSVDGVIRLWNAATGEPLQMFEGGSCDSLAFSSDDRWIASLSRGIIRVWDAVSRESVRPFRKNPFGAISMSGDGRQLASVAGGDRTVRVSDVQTGLQTTVLKGHGPASRVVGVTVAEFSSDGRNLATYAFDHAIRIWDLESGQQTRVISGREQEFPSLNCLAFSPDGGLIAGGRRTSVFSNPPPGACDVHIWDVATGAPVHVLRGHYQMIWSVQFSPDGGQLASASSDGTVRLWDCRTGQIIRIFTVNTEGEAGVYRALFSHDGSRIITESLDSTVWSWDVESGDGYILHDHDDPRVVAAGEWGPRFRARLCPAERRNELTIMDSSTGTSIAWWPVYFWNFLTHPSGRIWAGKGGVVALEDAPR